MGESEQDARYNACCEAVQEAAYAYARAHPFAEYRFRWWEFERDMAARAGKVLQPGESCAVAAAICDCYDAAASADARGMLEAMWAGSQAHGGGTYMMAKAVVQLQVQAQVKRVTREVTIPGNWKCISCPTLLNAYTSMDLDEKAAFAPGALTVCAACGALQQVNKAGNGYVDLPVRELNRLPKSVRTQLLHARNNVLHRLQLAQRRS